MRTSEFDVILVGGGLASALTALALLDRKPTTRIALVEREETLGGNHTWCFHAHDVPARARALIAPLVVARWDGYAVHFPGRSRRLASSYGCITSPRLHEVLAARMATAPGSALLLGREATQIGAREVTLDDGSVLQAKLVVCATGPAPSDGEDRGYQKFVGLELAIAPPHPYAEPVIFDARIPQEDGFRFMYVLPLAADRVLVEETFFSESERLDEARSTRAILDYAAAQGLRVTRVHRVERGVLPMPWRERAFDSRARPLESGYRGGLFHPVTGYSFPIALRFALALADSDLDALDDGSPLAAFARAHAAQRPLLRLLTRLLFTCFAPERRFSVLEHFYRLPEPLIARFYAAELSPVDGARIFLGAPPRGFSLGRAIRLHTGATP